MSLLTEVCFEYAHIALCLFVYPGIPSLWPCRRRCHRRPLPAASDSEREGISSHVQPLRKELMESTPCHRQLSGSPSFGLTRRRTIYDIFTQPPFSSNSFCRLYSLVTRAGRNDTSSSLAHYGEGAMHLIASQDTAQSVCMRNTLCVGLFSVSLNPF